MFIIKISNINYKIYNFHKNLLNNQITNIEELENERQTYFYSPIKIFKKIYINFYYLFENIYIKLFYKNNYNIKNIINEKIENVECLISDLKDITDDVIKKYNYKYGWGMVKFMKDHKWLNIKLSNKNMTPYLNDIDKYMLKSINKTYEFIKPIEQQITLYHGFLPNINYKEDKFNIGYEFKFNGILLKTHDINIAKKIAMTQNHFQPKIFIIKYNANSKHIIMDIIVNDEYKFITKNKESFKIINIFQYFEGIILYTFYICENLDY